MELNDLLLLSGNDIPFSEAGVSIHQPTIKEIAYLGERTFFTGCELLNFSKESLVSEDKDRLKNQTDFDIIMSIMREKNNPDLQENAVSALMVLVILFPNYTVEIQTNGIALIEQEDDKKIHLLNNTNYPQFKMILVQMFNIKKDKNADYNPSGDLAKKIADKLKRGNQKRAAQKGQQKKIAVLSRYASILAVGEAKDLNSLMQYTVYQLFDEFQRYELKINYEIYLQAKMAGAKDLKDVDNWMKDIHPSSIK